MIRAIGMYHGPLLRTYRLQSLLTGKKTKDEIKKIYHDPEHKALNVLESVENQCNWLREIGFSEVDCFMKLFEMNKCFSC